MSITKQLTGVSDKTQRAAIKALGLATAVGTSYSWSRGQYSAAVTNIRANAEMLSMHLSVKRSGKSVFEDDIVIVNPPIMINTGTSDAPVFTENAAGVIVAVLRDVLAERGLAL